MHGGGAWGRGGLALLLCPEHRPDRIARGHPSCLGSILLFIHSSLPIGTFLGVLLACVCLSSVVLWCALVCAAPSVVQYAVVLCGGLGGALVLCSLMIL